jgi:hypothetical protein
VSADPDESDQISPEVAGFVTDALRATTEVPVTLVDIDRIHGRTAPRIWTRPLRSLTPDTTYGFRFITWCGDQGYPLDPWQRWCAVHVGELLPDGRPRFRRVVIIVARQNGKTLLLILLILWWAYEDSRLLIVMTSTNLDYARESLFQAAEMAAARVALPRGFLRLRDVPHAEVRQANGQERMVAPVRRIDPDDEESPTVGGGTAMIKAASGKSGGRSLPIDRLVSDEVREQTTWDAYNAGKLAMNARKNGQGFFISNQGDHTAVVLRGLRRTAMSGQDRRIGIFEYSCPKGSRPDDLGALRYANPNMGTRTDHDIDPETLLGDALTAMQEGGAALVKYKTEIMCMDVPLLDPAIDIDKWRTLAGGGDMSKLRTRVATCLDVSPDGTHAALVAAAVDVDGRVRVEVVRVWDNLGTLQRTLPLAVARVKPRVFAWFPAGPAAGVATKLAARKQRRSAAWPPAGVEVREIRTEVPAVCMGLAQEVKDGTLVHPNDPLINAQVEDAQRHDIGDAWVFGRRDSAGPINVVYAVAGAVHEARMLPEAPRGRRLVIAT